MGGPIEKRKNHPLRVARLWNDQPGEYGEPSGWQIKGVECENLLIPTRFVQWRIERRSLGSSPLERIPDAGFKKIGMSESCPPWTCVNNCTHVYSGSSAELREGPQNELRLTTSGHLA